MSLEKNEIAAVPFVRRAPEVVEADVEQRADRCEARDMAAELVIALVRARHHDHRVPAAVRADALLERVIPRRALLQMRRNRIDVRGLRSIGKIGAGAARLLDQFFQQVVRALRTFVLEHAFEGVEPLLGFLDIGIVRGGELRQRGHGLSLSMHGYGTGPAEWANYTRSARP